LKIRRPKPKLARASGLKTLELKFSTKLKPHARLIERKKEHRRRVHVARYAIGQAMDGTIGETERGEVLAALRESLDEYEAKSNHGARDLEIVQWCAELIEKLGEAKTLVREKTSAKFIDNVTGLSNWLEETGAIITFPELLKKIARQRSGAALITYEVVSGIFDVTITAAQVKRIVNLARNRRRL
jgi:hypothetical protein